MPEGNRPRPRQALHVRFASQWQLAEEGRKCSPEMNWPVSPFPATSTWRASRKCARQHRPSITASWYCSDRPRKTGCVYRRGQLILPADKPVLWSPKCGNSKISFVSVLRSGFHNEIVNDLGFESRTVSAPRTRRSFLVAVLAICVAGLTISAWGQESATYPVTGVVLDRVTFRPIPAVEVTARGTETSTDSKGRFQLSLPPGVASIDTFRMGYRAKSRARFHRVRVGEKHASPHLLSHAVILDHDPCPVFRRRAGQGYPPCAVRGVGI